MDLLILLTYAAVCIAVFKVFKIPKNEWTVSSAILGGAVLLGGMLMLMNNNHAYAKYGREVFVTVPIVPEVSGQVVAVEVEDNSRVKKGDVLFRLDPMPFELELARAKAQLAQAGKQDLRETGNWKTARARVTRALAERDRARHEYERFASDPEAFSAMDVENRRQAAEKAEATLEAAMAEEESARLELQAKIEGEDPEVARMRAELRLAEYRLEQSVVHAPSDGLVTQLSLREGMAIRALPLRPAMAFIPIERRRFAASFWQNSLRRMEPGLEAEVILDAVPGHVFKGTVEHVLPAMSEGEYQAQGVLLSGDILKQDGRAVVTIILEENLDDYHLPLGVQGQAAVYSEHVHHVSVMRKVLLRMVSWLKYVFPIK